MPPKILSMVASFLPALAQAAAAPENGSRGLSSTTKGPDTHLPALPAMQTSAGSMRLLETHDHEVH